MSGTPSASQDFYERVYDVVEKIPYGRVTTYGAIARYLGSGRSSRMVGYALNKSLELPADHDKPLLPCHRVVNRLGQLTGRAYFGPGVMEALLRQEDIRFIEADTIDIDKHFWDPSEALPRPYTSD
jgi:methylated-DNA-protein-cysteine methyltransferase-like protein